MSWTSNNNAKDAPEIKCFGVREYILSFQNHIKSNDSSHHTVKIKTTFHMF